MRVGDPGWPNPLDATRSMAAGGRWNPPGSFPVTYLFSAPDVARSFVIAMHAGLPYSVLDVAPSRRPALVHTRVRERAFVDIVTDAGCRAADLPETYPRTRGGRRVGWSRCRPIGLTAWDQGEAGIACRSASARRADTGEELAWFQRRSKLAVTGVEPFETWFPTVVPGLDEA